jgi:putative ABC transport system substrate-binding protein
MGNFQKKQRPLLRKFVLTGLCLSLILAGCEKKVKEKEGVQGKYAIGVLLAYDSPTSTEVFKSMQDRLVEYQKKTGDRLDLVVQEAHGQVALLPEQAQQLSRESKLLVAISTPALQSAMIATDSLPIVFSSVANPYIVRAGRTAVDHDPRVTGVCSTAPIRQVMELVKQVLPGAKTIGTIWTPSEINSEYYLELMRESASDLGLEVTSQPISEAQDIVQAVQSLVRDRIEILFPVSDNTINANFDLVGRLAEENGLPLFAAFALGAELGACASMGFDFSDIGMRTADIVIRIRNGESPARIPFQYIDRVRFYVNEEAARKQGIKFPEIIIKKADRRIRTGDQVGNISGLTARSE